MSCCCSASFMNYSQQPVLIQKKLRNSEFFTPFLKLYGPQTYFFWCRKVLELDGSWKDFELFLLYLNRHCIKKFNIISYHISYHIRKVLELDGCWKDFELFLLYLNSHCIKKFNIIPYHISYQEGIRIRRLLERLWTIFVTPEQTMHKKV